MLNETLKLNKNIFNEQVEKKTTREAYSQTLIELAKVNANIVVLTADLAISNKTNVFEKAFPNRFIDVGVSEQNLAGISAGLALGGKIPFMDSYSTFSPGRNWEQIRTAICLTNTNVKIVSTHAGYSDGGDGATHQALEDIALLRVLPNITIFHPLDYYETIWAVNEAAKIFGPVYIRLGREATPILTTEQTPFNAETAVTLVKGSDITIAATGPITYEAILAAKELKEQHNINAEVLSFSTLKPFDTATLVESAKKTGKVITLEEHQISGGFGGIVCETLSELCPTTVVRMGAQNKFGESGQYTELLNKFKLSSKYIIIESLKLCNK